MRYLIALVVLAAAGCVAPGVYTLSSRMEGVVYLDGEPVSGAEIDFIARSMWFGDGWPILTETDETGGFVIAPWKRAF